RLRAFENAGDIDPGRTVSVGQFAAIAHQAAGGDELADFVDRWDRVTDGKRGELFAAGGEKRIGADDEAACPQFDQSCEDRIEVALGAGIQDVEPQAEGAGRRLQGSCIYLGKSGIGRVDEVRNGARRGDQFVQQFQPLRRYLRVQVGHARDVAARSVKAGDEVELDRVGGQFDDDRNGRRRCPCRKRRRSRGRGYHGYLTMNQISRQSGQPFVFIPGEAIFDSCVLTLDKACVFQTLTERGEELWGVAGRPGVEDPDHRHRLGLPRPRHERPRNGGAAEQHDELATFQLIEWHSAPASQAQIAAYRFDHSQSADILNLVNRWPVPPRYRLG